MLISPLALKAIASPIFRPAIYAVEKITILSKLTEKHTLSTIYIRAFEKELLNSFLKISQGR